MESPVLHAHTGLRGTAALGDCAAPALWRLSSDNCCSALLVCIWNYTSTFPRAPLPVRSRRAVALYLHICILEQKTNPPPAATLRETFESRVEGGLIQVTQVQFDVNPIPPMLIVRAGTLSHSFGFIIPRKITHSMKCSLSNFHHIDNTDAHAAYW